MRKKLFAVIMSAMMMVTFMPAMAFAAAEDPTPATTGAFQISGVTGYYYDGDEKHLTYDGTENEVTWIVNSTGKINPAVTYSGYGTVRTGSGTTKAWTSAPSATPIKVKDAGSYTITATEKYYTNNEVAKTVWYVAVGFVTDNHENQYVAGTVLEAGPELTYLLSKYKKYLAQKTIPAGLVSHEDTNTITIHIAPREAVVTLAQYATFSKDYDGKGFTVDDSLFQISAKKDATTGKEVANTGLVAGDKLILESFTTPVDANTYYITWNAIKTNPNYTFDFQTKLDKVTINQAGNDVTLSKTNKTYKAKALKNGKKSFKINPKSTWGTVKVTKVGGSGWLYLNGNKVVVKKGCKKGTYKIKVKAYVGETKNWKGAELTKVINVKVK